MLSNFVKQVLWKSSAGKKQMYEIGKDLKLRYGDFLGDYRDDRVYVSSTESSRTIMSALCTMAGMFPSSIFKNLPWQPIPVWQTTLEMDKSFVFLDRNFPDVTSKLCPKYVELASDPRAKFKSPDKRPEFEKFYQLVQQYTNSPTINTPKQLRDIYDTIYSAQHNGLSIPDWALLPQPEFDNKPIFPDLLLPFMSAYYFTKLLYEENEKMLHFMTGPLFHTINGKLLKKSSKIDSPEKFWFHSTHDITMYALLRELRFDDLECADPGDGVIFELHEENNNIYVKIFTYDANANEMKEKESPMCPSPCTLLTFTTTFKALSPEQWTLKCTAE